MLNLNSYYNDEDRYGDYSNEDEDEEDKGPALEIYGTDLTLLAKEGKLEECFGREQELLEMMEILVRRQKNNPVLVGDAGVGKTAIVELFATKIVNNLVPFVLEGRTLISLDLARIVAGSRYRGEFELRFQKVLDEVLAQPNIIIFIDEIHNIGGTGSAEGSLDAANILKPVLSRSGFQCIGATTTKEYQRIEKDPALNRRFQPIKVKEPSIEETVNILYGLRPSLEAFHNVEILPGAIRLAADLSARYIYDRFLPDKAIDLIDRAAAKEVIRLTNVTEGSVIASLANAGLNNIGALRVEAFRRGDIASEFVFQEIENAYRNFLLRWIEEPLTIPEEAKLMLSPISQNLFDKMRMSVLKRVDDLLFSSSQIRTKTQKVNRIKDLSIEKNNQIYKQLASDINEKEYPKLSLYRISLFLFGERTQGEEFGYLLPNLKEKYFKDLVNLVSQSGMYEYLTEQRHSFGENQILFNPINDFCSDDIESYEESFEILSELEEKRIEVFKEFLKELKPILRKGVIESLKFSSEVKISDTELVTIYNLLGYFSTDTGKEFLYNLEDPELIRRARKLGDFSGLKKRITQREVRELLASMTGIPIQSLSAVESQKLVNLESTLHKRVIGQEEGISAIAKAIRRSRLGIQNPNRPIARLTDAVRRKPYSVVLFDEVEKAHPDVLNILLQILEDGRLTDSQKRLIPFENTIIIMTSNAAAAEIQQIIKTERANGVNSDSENNEKLSQEDEKFTVYEDSYAGAIKFLKSPITENFLTDIKEQLSIEFERSFRNMENYKRYQQELLDKENPNKEKKKETKTPSNLKSTVLDRLSTMFLPEFLNRLDDIIIFQPLKPEELRKICDIMINEVAKRVEKKQIILTVEDRVKTKLTREGYNPSFGARPLRRLVTKYIEDLISEDILNNTNNTRKSRTVNITLNENDQIIVEK